MITRAIVEGFDINEDGTKKAIVRIPIFNGIESSPNGTSSAELSRAIEIATPGISETLNTGDAVFVGFEDNDMSKPVILGHLIGDNQFVNFVGSSLKIETSAMLPTSTTIGNITYEMLLGAIRWWRNFTGGTTPGGTGDVVYITLTSPNGTFEPETLSALLNNNLNQLIYNGAHYSLGFNDGSNIRRYITTVQSNGRLQYIEVNTTNRTWTYVRVLNEALQAHINDTSSHIQSGEREYWNDKITCTLDTVNTEKLILTKSNLL